MTTREANEEIEVVHQIANSPVTATNRSSPQTRTTTSVRLRLESKLRRSLHLKKNVSVPSGRMQHGTNSQRQQTIHSSQQCHVEPVNPQA